MTHVVHHVVIISRGGKKKVCGASFSVLLVIVPSCHSSHMAAAAAASPSQLCLHPHAHASGMEVLPHQSTQGALPVCSHICLCVHLTEVLFKSCDRRSRSFTGSPLQTCSQLLLSPLRSQQTKEQSEAGADGYARPIAGFYLPRRSQTNPD